MKAKEEYKKILQSTARKEFNKGKSIYLYPSKCVIGVNLLQPFEISNINTTFDKAIQEYRLYNCNETTGTKVNCYVKIGK